MPCSRGTASGEDKATHGDCPGERGMFHGLMELLFNEESVCGLWEVQGHLRYGEVAVGLPAVYE